MTSEKMYNVVLDEFGFDAIDAKGFRRLRSERFSSCWSEFQDGKIQLNGSSKGEYKTGFLKVSEMQLRQLLTIIVQNHI